jgi:hypothetical protein
LTVIPKRPGDTASQNRLEEAKIVTHRIEKGIPAKPIGVGCRGVERTLEPVNGGVHVTPGRGERRSKVQGVAVVFSLAQHELDLTLGAVPESAGGQCLGELVANQGRVRIELGRLLEIEDGLQRTIERGERTPHADPGLRVFGELSQHAPETLIGERALTPASVLERLVDPISQRGDGTVHDTYQERTREQQEDPEEEPGPRVDVGRRMLSVHRLALTRVNRVIR